MTRPLTLTAKRIWTGVPARPWARSVTVVDGRVVALDAPAPPGARRLATDGVVVPGFVDAHVHLVMAAEQARHLDLSGVTSREAFVAAIAGRHAELPPGAWLVGRGWSESRWGGAAPDKGWLAAAGDRPVVCLRADLHAAVVNDAVLAQTDLHIERGPAWGGRVERGADGAPDGRIAEAALWDVVQPRLPAPTDAERRAALHAAVAELHRFGVTAVGSMEDRATVEHVLVPEIDDLALRVRVTLLDALDAANGVELESHDRLAVIGAKTFLDGTLGSRTARMLAPYADAPDTLGLWLDGARPDVLDAWLRGVVARGWSPSLHAIGDAAVRAALDAFDRTDTPRSGPTGVRLEHVQQIHPDDLPRFDGLWTSMQPLHLADDALVAEARLGAGRLDGCFAFAALARAGARLAFGSDWPVVPPDPMAAVRCAVTMADGRGRPFRPDHALPVEAALRAHTVEAAAMLGLSGAGALRPGAVGDVAVLDRDPFETDWLRAPPAVLATIFGGAVVFGDGAFG